MSSTNTTFTIDPIFEAIRAPQYYNFQSPDTQEGDTWFKAHNDDENKVFEEEQLLPDEEFDIKTPPKPTSIRRSKLLPTGSGITMSTRKVKPRISVFATSPEKPKTEDKSRTCTREKTKPNRMSTLVQHQKLREVKNIVNSKTSPKVPRKNPSTRVAHQQMKQVAAPKKNQENAESSAPVKKTRESTIPAKQNQEKVESSVLAPKKTRVSTIPTHQNVESTNSLVIKKTRESTAVPSKHNQENIDTLNMTAKKRTTVTPQHKPNDVILQTALRKHHRKTVVEQKKPSENNFTFKALPLDRRILESCGDIGVPRLDKIPLTQPLSPHLHLTKRFKTKTKGLATKPGLRPVTNDVTCTPAARLI